MSSSSQELLHLLLHCLQSVQTQWTKTAFQYSWKGKRERVSSWVWYALILLSCIIFLKRTMTSFLTYPARVIMNVIQTESKNRWLRASERKRDLPIICNKETTLAYHKTEVRSLLGWAIICHQTGMCRLLLDVIYGELHKRVSVMSMHSGLLFYNMEMLLKCGWLRSKKYSLKCFIMMH